MDQGACVLLLGTLDLGQQGRHRVRPRVGVRPAHERVERPRLALGVTVVKALEVLLSFRLGPGRGDLRDLRISGVHLRRDSTNWRRVSDLTGWWRNRCSWACSTATYTTGRAPPIDDAGLVRSRP